MSAQPAAGPEPVRCPVLPHPRVQHGDPALFEPLLDRLGDPEPVSGAEVFPRGTLRDDGRLDLCKQGLGPDSARAVLRAAARSPLATHLLLGTNALGSDGVQALADALDGEHGFETLYLGCNGIDGDAVRPLLDRLAGDGRVRGLWLKRNPLGDAGVRAVAATLAGNHAIRTLDLVNTGLTVDGLRALAAALAARPRRVERLFLGGNGLGPEAAEVLAGLLVDAGVRGLYLAANHLGDGGARVLAGACAPAGGPLSLGLGGNGLSPAGVEALAAALGEVEALDLGRPPSEQVLGATSNHAGDAGVAAIASALPGSRLRHLNLAHTGVTAAGAKLLLAAVRRGTALEHLALGPGVPRRVRRAIAPHLRPAAPPHPDLRAIGSGYR